MSPVSLTSIDDFFRNSMLPIVTAYDVEGLYDFKFIDEQLIQNMKFSGTDNIDWNVTAN